MNSTTRPMPISFRSRASSCAGVSSGAEEEVEEGTYDFSEGEAGERVVEESAVGGARACFAMSCVSLAASAPSMRERSVCP